MNEITSLLNEDLSKFSLKELIELQSKLLIAIKKGKLIEKKEVLDKLRALAKESGFMLDELLLVSDKAKSTSQTKIRGEIKYRNPDNIKQTWKGKGRKPFWIIEKLNYGSKLEQFEIK